MKLPAKTVDFCTRADGWAGQRSQQARSLWAKSGDGVDHLNLPQHMVDSACAASLVYNSWLSRSVKEFLKAELRVSETDIEVLYVFLAGAHDVGKGVKTFQRLLLDRSDVAHLVHAVSDAGLDIELSASEANMSKLPHGIASGEILAIWLEEQGLTLPKANSVAAVVNAHHGAASGPNKAVRELIQDYPSAWRMVHGELLDAMAKLCGENELAQVFAKLPKVSPAAAQMLTGLVVMADWIASNEKAFSLRVEGTQLDRVTRAAELIDLTSPWEPETRLHQDIDEQFRQSFGWPAEFKARQVQQEMVEAARAINEPALIVLEAETGVGKTEAALAAAEVLAARSGAQGIFFAAPTMATANGLLQRTIEWSRNITTDSVRSMYLAHSKNALAKPYTDLKFTGINRYEEKGGNVVASQWMSGRRLGILSNFVVGTVDQVLMMALQQRFSMLRHVGLAGKVVIFDEVHSFDVYSSDYLRSAIEWLGFYGASVIVMSATLPADKRRALVSAYSDGQWPEEEPTGYPLITVATEDEIRSLEVPASPTDLEATISFLAEGEDSLHELLGEWLVDGGCVLIICNTIARAQAAYSELAESYGDCVELHHAGFVAWERVEKEDSLRRQLGPDAHRGAGRPKQKIVVATQVAEQSLDIDADALITDIAPMDLLIQRIGRLHRHARPSSDRPENLREPQVVIRGLETSSPVPEFESGAEAIYGRAILLSTYAVLPNKIRRPDDIAPLVAAAYDRNFKPPEAWNESWEEAIATRDFEESTAHSASSTFRLPDPWSTNGLDALFARLQDDSADDAEIKGAAQVRDAEPSVEVIPIIETDYGYRPWGWDEEVIEAADIPYRLAFHLASSTVRLPVRMTRYDWDFNSVVDDLEGATPAEWGSHYLLRGQLALPLNEKGETQVGRFVLQYTSQLGIEIMSDGRE